MPSTITHAYFMLDIYDNLDENAKKLLKNHLEYLKVFAQGPDPLYFYNYTKAKIKILSFEMHITKTRAFFLNLVTFIKEHQLEYQPEVIAYLYGSIAHYVLDSTVHPFVFYQTGFFNKKKKNTYKYIGLHLDMETYIDAYMIYIKENIEPEKFKLHQFCFNVDNFSLALKDTIDDVINTTYQWKHADIFYLKAIKQMKSFFHLFRYDPYGLKKRQYQRLDQIIPKPSFRFVFLSYNINLAEKRYYLNLEKNKWNHPTDKNEVFDLSFPELYMISLQKALSIINDVNEVLYNNRDIKRLKRTFLNLSYLTGKPCELKQEMIYFAF
ncbi:MAG: zinc dependent phospholipase C family protein [Bacilli bacterium]